MNRVLVLLILFFVFIFLVVQEKAVSQEVLEKEVLEGETQNKAILEAGMPHEVLAKDILPKEDLPDKKPKPEKKVREKFTRMKNRTIEFSFVNTSVHFFNDFVGSADFLRDPFDMMASKKIFKETATVNVDDFFDGFTLGFGMAIKPFSFNFNWKDRWGFGLDVARVDVAGNVFLSGDMLSFSRIDKDVFGAGAAVFADVGIPVFFPVKEYKIKIRPAAYLPVLYTEPNIIYRHKIVTDSNGNKGTRIDIDYDMRAYSLVNMQELMEGNMLDVLINMGENYQDILANNLGYDLGLGIEYPWNNNLDIGVDISNIPIYQSKLFHYMQIKGNAFFDASKMGTDDMINDLIAGEFVAENLDDFFGYSEFDEKAIIYRTNSAGKKIARPFTMLFYANYHPFKTSTLSFIPSLGFSINRLYVKPAAIEGGLSTRIDFANILVTTLGINYNNRRWVNSIDFMFNLRAFQLDLGLSLQSPKLKRGFDGMGLGVNFGLKMGF